MCEHVYTICACASTAHNKAEIYSGCDSAKMSELV